MLRITFSMFCLGICTLLLLTDKSYATENQSFPPPVAAAIGLWKLITLNENRDIFDTLKLNSVTGSDAPLARYRPENGGVIEIGQNLRSYRRDYIYLSSPIDMSTKPDFDQYLTVMFMLSLSNEAAHILQDKNGSLKDFYKSYKSGNTLKACAIYALQQHASDIMMLKSAMQVEMFFLGKGSTKGINALRLALQKNNLRDEFEDFREAMKRKNLSELNRVLSSIRIKRNALNMSGLKFCPSSFHIQLDKKIILRATAPIGFPFEK